MSTRKASEAVDEAVTVGHNTIGWVQGAGSILVCFDETGSEMNRTGFAGGSNS